MKSTKETIKEFFNPVTNNDSYNWVEGDVVYIFGIKHVCKKDKNGQYRYVRA